MKTPALLLSLLMLIGCITGPPPEQRDPTWTPTASLERTVTDTSPVGTPVLSVTPGATSTAPILTDTITPHPTPTRIVLPRPTVPAVLCVEVVQGDTLADIAANYDVQPNIIVDWNKRKFPSLITNPDLLEIGWVICMPVGFDTNTPSPKTTP